MAEKKSQAEQLKEKLFYVKKHATLVMSEQEEKKADKYCEGYKSFLNAAKTEREAVNTAVALAKEKGFTEFVYGKKYNAGDKVFFNNRGKTVAFAAADRNKN